MSTGKVFITFEADEVGLTTVTINHEGKGLNREQMLRTYKLIIEWLKNELRTRKGMTDAERRLLEDIRDEVADTDCSWKEPDDIGTDSKLPKMSDELRENLRKRFDKALFEDDAVHHPKHYQLEGLDCESIDVIRAVLGADGFRAFCRGNVLKYMMRADKKGGEEDLEKALVYLKWELKN